MGTGEPRCLWDPGTSFRLEKAGSAWVLVWEEAPLTDCWNQAHQMALLPLPHSAFPSSSQGVLLTHTSWRCVWVREREMCVWC